MNKLSYLLSTLVLVFVLAISGCDGDDGPGVPAADQVGLTFSGTWSASSVTFGSPSQDRTSDYSGFSMTVTYVAGTNGGSLSISGGPDGLRPFAPTDTWSYSGEITDPATTAFSITRQSDGLNISVSNLTANTMSLSFLLADGGSTSRQEAVVGTWNFDFTR